MYRPLRGNFPGPDLYLLVIIGFGNSKNKKYNLESPLEFPPQNQDS